MSGTVLKEGCVVPFRGSGNLIDAAFIGLHPTTYAADVSPDSEGSS
jgi:hypothetical protein